MDHELDTVIGPFPIGEWSMWFSNPYLGLVVSWFNQNREGFNVLYHPNSGCEYEDHTDWAIWIGNK